MVMQIRPARITDQDVIVEFNFRLAEETEGKLLDRDLLERGVAAMLADPAKGRYFLAEDQGQVLGQLGITREWSDWRNGDFWWVQSVYVRADARRRGIFSALFQHVEAEARNEKEVIGIRLYVDEHNQIGQATYVKLGFTRTEYWLLEKALGIKVSLTP